MEVVIISKNTQITVKIDKTIYNKVKSLFGDLSFNKALIAMLIHSGDYEVVEPELKKDINAANVLESLKYHLNSRLKTFGEQLEERFNKIEANLIG